MKFFLLIFLLAQVQIWGGVDFSVFDAYQERWSREEVEDRLQSFLQKGERAGRFFTVTDEAITLYNGPDHQKDREVEYQLKFAKNRLEKGPLARLSSLVGVKIAIDPGHLGGPYARLEERFIDIPPSLERDSSVQFDEGTLAFLTASYLKILLEKEGAIVLLTRNKIGQGVYKENFFDWLRSHPGLWNGGATLKKLFRTYNLLDLRARAEKINAFSPDLSIIIHYNSHDVEEPHSSNNCVAPQNYNLVFIPGGFCRNELAAQEDRFEFMRLLVTEDLPRSHALSGAILKAFTEKLKVPAITSGDGAHYLDRVSLKVADGVYARNLALTRLVHSPVCYGETLIQNNVDECLNLSKTDFVIDGRACSSRIKQVAEAYFSGIQTYLLSD